MKIFNSPEFAKEILWRLAKQQADAQEIKMLAMEILSRQTGQPAEEIQKKWKADSAKMANEIYLKSLKAVGFADDADTIEGNDNDRP